MLSIIISYIPIDCHFAFTFFPSIFLPEGFLLMAMLLLAAVNVGEAGWPGRYINVRRCVGLSMVLLQLKDPLELFVKSSEFLPGPGFLSRRDMT